MKHIAMAFLFCLTSSIANVQPRLSDLDWPVIELEWKFIKQRVGAPIDLPMPPIIVETLPPGARMMFQFPIHDDSDYDMQIIISPETLKHYGYEMIDWGLGHELTHYAFIMRDNNWDYTKKTFVQTFPHHCNPEFMRITRNIADLIYNIHHGQRERYMMLNEVQRSCLSNPTQ